MTKYLLLALLIAWLVYASPWSRSRKSSAPTANKPTPPAPPQPMVACAHCGVHLPANEAQPGPQTSGASIYFCSEGHRLAGPRTR
jgi:uncharacterized protein